ncbi:ATP-binding cassette domain-containing protein [Sphingomonas sp. MMS24-JH45]
MVRAFARDPELVILDKPLDGARAGAEALERAILRQIGPRGRALLLLTQDEAFANRACERVLRAGAGTAGAGSLMRRYRIGIPARLTTPSADHGSDPLDRTMIPPADVCLIGVYGEGSAGPDVGGLSGAPPMPSFALVGAVRSGLPIAAAAMPGGIGGGSPSSTPGATDAVAGAGIAHGRRSRRADRHDARYRDDGNAIVDPSPHASSAPDARPARARRARDRERGDGQAPPHPQCTPV